MTNSRDTQRKLHALVIALADVLDLAVQEVLDRHSSAPSPIAPAAPRPPAVARDDGHGLWTVADVAGFLKTSRSWVYKEVEKGTFPVIRVGALLRFDPAEVRRMVGLDEGGGASRGRGAHRAGRPR